MASNRAIQFGLLTAAGILLYSGIKGESVIEVLAGSVGATLDPRGGSTISPSVANPGYGGAPIGPSGVGVSGGPIVATGGAKVIGYPCKGTHIGLGNWQSDNAIDLAVPVNTIVVAPESGKVLKVKTAHDGCGGGGRFAGNQVTIQGQSTTFFMTHLCSVRVKTGQKIKAGEVIGTSGEANGVAHVHFAVQPPANVCDYAGDATVDKSQCKVCRV